MISSPLDSSGIGSLASTKAARDNIDAQIRELENSIRTLRTRRNSLAPINRVPQELMTEIFSSLQAIAGHAWVGMLAVCRHWHDVALNYPKLWSTIHLGYNQWETQLKRAKSHLLILHSTGDDFYSVGDNYKPRIREFHARFPMDLSEGVLDYLKSHSFPNLQVLSLRNQGHIRSLFDIHIPNLRELTLVNFGFDWDPVRVGFRGLTRLSLKGCNANVGIEQVLRMLEANAGLEILELYGTVPNCTIPCFKLLHMHRIPADGVRLPRLSYLSISSPRMLECVHFINHLNFPIHASIRCASGDDIDARGFTTGLSLFPPPPIPAGYRLVLAFGPNGEACIRISSMSGPPIVRKWSGRSPPSPPELAFSFFTTTTLPLIGGSTQITFLDINLGQGNTISMSQWSRALNSFPYLTEIRLGCDSAALREFVPSLIPLSTSTFPAPRLRKLHTVQLDCGRDLRTGIGEDLRRSLFNRRIAGCGLFELKITECKYPKIFMGCTFEGVVDFVDYGEDSGYVCEMHRDSVLWKA